MERPSDQGKRQLLDAVEKDYQVCESDCRHNCDKISLGGVFKGFGCYYSKGRDNGA
jgi:hypothetical protein